MASKRKTLGVGQKVDLINAIEEGEKKTDVEWSFGLSTSTIVIRWKHFSKQFLNQ